MEIVESRAWGAALLGAVAALPRRGVNRILKSGSCPIGISASMAQTRWLVPYRIGISPSMAQTRWLVPYLIGISPSMAQGRCTQRFLVTGCCAADDEGLSARLKRMARCWAMVPLVSNLDCTGYRLRQKSSGAIVAVAYCHRIRSTASGKQAKIKNGPALSSWTMGFIFLWAGQACSAAYLCAKSLSIALPIARPTFM